MRVWERLGWFLWGEAGVCFVLPLKADVPAHTYIIYIYIFIFVCFFNEGLKLMQLHCSCCSIDVY